MSSTVPERTEDDSRPRWTYVVVPLCAVLIISVIALGMTVLRRRFITTTAALGAHPFYHNRNNNDPNHYYYYNRGHYRHGPPEPPPRHPRVAVYRCDLEDPSASRPYPQGESARNPSGRRGRWRDGPPREEGLNELGEAPPPYSGASFGGEGGKIEPGSGAATAAAGGATRNRDAVVEMSGLEGASSGVHQQQQEQEPEGRTPAAPHMSMPPAYSESAAPPRTTTTMASSSIRPPDTAVLGPERRA